jgi:hypothetical protein
MYAARVSPESLHIPNKDFQEAFVGRGTAVSKVRVRAALALPSGILGGISKTSRWFAGISTVCSMVIAYLVFSIIPYRGNFASVKKEYRYGLYAGSRGFGLWAGSLPPILKMEKTGKESIT